VESNRFFNIISHNLEKYFPSAAARRTGLLLLIASCLAFLVIPEMYLERTAWDNAKQLEKKSKELSSIGKEYASIKVRIDAIRRKSSLTSENGITDALDAIVTALGIKPKMKTVKSIGTTELKQALKEEKAEVLFEGISMNELVNLFAEIDSAPVMLSVKKANMRKRFEDPELLNISLTIALYTPSVKKPDA
jgi:hypothetical protein